LKDGTGTSNLAKVRNGQLNTLSITEELAIYQSHIHSDYFAANTLYQTLNSTNEHLMMYARNDNPNKSMCIVVYLIGWNGGSTNHNRTCRYKWYKNISAPTANNLVLVPVNTNYKSTNLSGVTCNIWDGVGNGMTFTTVPIIVSTILAIGTTQIWLNGIPILGYGQSLGISVIGEEIGDISITLRFYMIDNTDLL
jgi:hypothetical protein